MNNTTIDSLEFHHDVINQHQPMSFVFDLRFFLVRIFYPSLLIWGTIGNTLCLRVLLSKKFCKNSTCQYLAVLAVIDILFIVMRSSKHVYRLFRDTTIFNTSKWICRILTFFSSALAHMGSWILVIVSFDRYFIVTSRYRRHSSAFNRVLCSTSILVAIVVLCNIYYFFILGRSFVLGKPGMHDHRRLLFRLLFQSNETSHNINHTIYPSTDLLRYKPTSIFVCIPAPQYERFFRTYIPIFDVLLVAAIPLILLCCTNIGIITFTMRNNRQMRQHRKRSHRRHQRLTIMLLSVTLAFIGLTCPSVIFICVNKIIYSGRILNDSKDNSNSEKNVRQPTHMQSLVDICEALWYTKHSMNFILYTLNGQDFRREFLKLFTHCFNRRSYLVRKLLSKTRPRTSLNESNIETQLRSTNIHNKIFHRKNSDHLAVTDVNEASSAIFTNSNSMQFKSSYDDKQI
ncbi:unnamed protein product [Rotaria sp. Silwood1]|nr:unnamed protein product [Rotaria sp. Silwood1]CAF3573635.1 unnamed protein product [Rotaria sp. Silwood1]CAF3596100.1 unnamed protein product [Rotaria sp. Silwood1]CAF4504034.1 unnamed protein product [Rotaria sp. Silwood1]CAF4685838.1 unnamed protein product [Rotaria sp. Silwood1]